VIVKALVVGQLQTNCYVIGDSETGKGAVIDPGGDARDILDAADGLQICYVINTHAHFDHVMGNSEVMQALSDRQEVAPELVAHPEAGPLLAADAGARWFGLAPVPSPQPDRFVNDGDRLSLGRLSLEVIHTPGHSPGSISFYCASAGVLYAGDVLFRQGVGRPDLPGGDWGTLVSSIRDRLFAYPDETVVYPGHGPSTTIGHEKRHNPYLRGM
jgi:glyoxylase-like metal-dependent hydrolase (beta-lactamase superfamily II)